jgi:hypothetical protein
MNWRNKNAVQKEWENNNVSNIKGGIKMLCNENEATCYQRIILLDKRNEGIMIIIY